jgi:hypothetical protein
VFAERSKIETRGCLDLCQASTITIDISNITKRFHATVDHFDHVGEVSSLYSQPRSS